MDYKEINNDIIKEPGNDYYNEVYESGQIKEQLEVGLEVKKNKQITGTFDTSDNGINQVLKVYNLNVPNPDGEIFSIGIDGNEKTFQIGFFNNSSLAYSTLETELQNWLGVNYIVTYISGTNFSIKKTDGGTVIKTDPDLIRNIDIANFDSLTKVDIIVDGTTFTLDGLVIGASDPAGYLESQLDSNIYFTNKVSNTNLLIARKDGDIPVISSSDYSRYTYRIIGLSESPGISISQFLQYTHVFGVGGSGSPSILNIRGTIDGNLYQYTYPTGNTDSTVNFSYNYENVAEILSRSNKHVCFSILADKIYSGLLLDSNYVLSNYELKDDKYPTAGVGLLSVWFNLRKTDYSQITYDNNLNTEYINNGATITKWWSQNTLVGTNSGVNELGLRFEETLSKATVTISTYTEIVKTLTLTGNSFFIPINFKIKKIEIKAISNTGNSEGIWERNIENCTSKYGSTTEFINNRIFKTDGNNYGNITQVNASGIIMTWTTNTSNKISYICS